jgi:transcriptional regulator with XRE-family HTH domain
MSVGPIIRDLRKKERIPQKEIAEKLHYSQPSGMCMLEKGKADIKASDIPKVAEALGMDVIEVCKEFFLKKNFNKTEQ